MKKLTEAQINLMAKLEASIEKLQNVETEANRANLFILERELRHMRTALRNAIDLQCRAFRDDSLTDPEPLFPQGMFPYGRHLEENQGTGSKPETKRVPTLYYCANCGGRHPANYTCTR
jgi:hypothetical protein